MRVQLAEQNQQIEWLMQLRMVRQKPYDTSSEKASGEVLEQLSLLFDEAEVYVVEEEAAQMTQVATHIRRSPAVSKTSLFFSYARF